MKNRIHDHWIWPKTGCFTTRSFGQGDGFESSSLRSELPPRLKKKKFTMLVGMFVCVVMVASVVSIESKDEMPQANAHYFKTDLSQIPAFYLRLFAGSANDQALRASSKHLDDLNE